MERKYISWLLYLLIVCGLLILSIGFSLIFGGELDFSLIDLPRILADKSDPDNFIIMELRVPRVILAFAVGGALSLSGAILQGIYRNPLVEPYTLGISGGAAFAIALVIVMGWHRLFGSLLFPFAGFIGALSTIFLVYFLSIRKGIINIHKMLLIGVMISFLASSSIMFLMSKGSAADLHSFVFWTMGSLDEPNRDLISVMLTSSLAGLALSYFFVRPLNAMRLGEIKARHLGFNSALTVRMLFILSSLLTGICVAVVGIIGFVGLIIPHIVRLIIGNDYRIMLIGSFLGGSLYLIVCDILARSKMLTESELPIGVVTGMLGGIVFIAMLSASGSKIKLS
ncbi:MAG: iron ABC transporter permease [Bacteroidales bacterium]|nr:iron ABC transporter permease [Bacteroidales bacterium]